MVLDKGLTILNIHQVQKNFPEADAIGIEKNPVARFFFKNFGIWGGTIIYGLISLLLMILVFFILKHFFGEAIALYAIFMLYVIALGNNIFFLLKYSKII
jgi:hypothetical protein